MITQYFLDSGLSPTWVIVFALAVLAGILAGTWICVRSLAWIFDIYFVRLAKKTKNCFDDFVVCARVPHQLFQVIASVLLLNYLPLFLVGDPIVERLCDVAVEIYFAVAVANVICALLNAWMFYIANARGKSLPLKGFVEAAKYIVVAGTALLVLAILTNKSPVYFLSALGAAMAVLLIVFRDSLLGLTAGLTILLNDIVRKDDWIEIPSQGVDGVVRDITLTTVKIENWDNTVSCVPSYTLVSSSIRNWRNMVEVGARRIKRSFRVNLRSIHFLEETELTNLKNAFPQIAEQISAFPQTTNLAVFRAYCQNYLKNSSAIRQDLTVMVRQLEINECGLLIEIYAFSVDTNLGAHEQLAAQLIEHFIAIAPEFSVEIYQR